MVGRDVGGRESCGRYGELCDVWEMWDGGRVVGKGKVMRGNGVVGGRER